MRKRSPLLALGIILPIGGLVLLALLHHSGSRKQSDPRVAAREGHQWASRHSTSDDRPDRSRLDLLTKAGGNAAPGGDATEEPLSGEAGARIFGRVVMKGAEDVPVAGADVFLAPGTAWDQPISRTTSGENGEFVFKGAAEGAGRTVIAVKEGLCSTAAAGKGKPVRVGPGERRVGPVVLKMVHSPQLKLLVTSEITKGPLAGASVKLKNFFDRIEKTSDTGELTITTTPEAWNLDVWAPGHALGRATVDMSAGKNRSTDIELKAGGEVFGIVTDEKAKPVPNIRVSARVGGPPPSGVTDDKGAYRIEGVQIRDSITLWIDDPNLSSLHEEQTIDLSAEAPSKRVDFVLNYERALAALGKGLAIKGLVQDEEKRPIARAVVVYGLTAQTPDAQNYTDADGRFFLKGIPSYDAKSYVVVNNPGYAPARVRQDAGPLESPPEVTITLKQGYWVKGTVVDSKKIPIGKATVVPTILGREERKFAVRTQEDGRFEFDSLDEDAKLLVSADGYADRRSVPVKLNRDDFEIVMRRYGMILGSVIDGDTELPITQQYSLLVQPQADPNSDEPFIEFGQPQNTQSFHDDSGEFTLKNLRAGAIYKLRVQSKGYPATAFDQVQASEDADLAPVMLKLKKGGLSVQGAVVSQEFKPVPGARVRLVAYEQKSRGDTRFRWAEASQSDGFFSQAKDCNEDGLFNFDGIPEGHPIDMLIVAKGFGRKRVQKVELLSEDARLAMIITLPTSARVHGTLNRESLPQVSALDLSDARYGESLGHKTLGERDTNYLFDDLPAGKYKLALMGDMNPNANGGGFATSEVYSKQIELAEGEDLEVNLGVDKSYKLSGTVTISGEPLSGKWVVLNSGKPPSQSQRTAITDSSGHFAWEHVAPGEYVFNAVDEENGPTPWGYRGGSDAYQQPFRMPEEDTARDFAFDRLPDVVGRIVNPPGGNPSVTLMPSTEREGRWDSMRYAPVNSLGRFSLKHALPGEYSLMLSSRSNSSTLRERIVVPPGGANIDLGDIALGQGGTIQVTIDRGYMTNIPPGAVGVTTRRPDTPRTSGAYLAYGNIPPTENSCTVVNQPEGPVRVEIGGGSYISDPRFQIVDVAQGQTSQVSFTLRPITSLTFIGEVKPNSNVSIVGSRKAGGETVTFERADLHDIARFESIPSAYYSIQNEASQGIHYLIASARGLAEGIWEFKITLDGGKTQTKLVELKLGEHIQEMLNDE